MQGVLYIVHCVSDGLFVITQFLLALEDYIVVADILSLDVDGEDALLVDEIPDDAGVVDHVDEGPVLEIQSHAEVVELHFSLLELYFVPVAGIGKVVVDVAVQLEAEVLAHVDDLDG